MSALLLASILLAAPSPVVPTPLALTVSGGVSLGAYEAGYLYYSLAAQRANPSLSRVLVATGSSAGSVNALLSLRASCAGTSLDPRESLFYRVWIPMGLKQLFRPDGKNPLAAFSQDSLVRVGTLVEEELARGLPEDCDVVLGIVASRVSPRLLHAASDRLKVPVTEERFSLRIRGRGPGRMPLLTNYVDADDEDEQAMLPEGPDGTVPFAALLDAVIASTSFPIAFPPRPVKHCVVETKGKTRPFCPEGSATTALFVDGGVFDNSPLRLAATFAAGGLRPGPDGALHWRESPGLQDPGAPPRGMAFAFLSADAAAFPDQLASSATTGDPSILPLLIKELGGFVNSARSRELFLLIQDYPETAANLIYPRRHFPAASSLRPRLPLVRFRPRHVRGPAPARQLHPSPRPARAAGGLHVAGGSPGGARGLLLLGAAGLPPGHLRRGSRSVEPLRGRGPARRTDPRPGVARPALGPVPLRIPLGAAPGELPLLRGSPVRQAPSPRAGRRGLARMAPAVRRV
jgi:hypothetical protein